MIFDITDRKRRRAGAHPSRQSRSADGPPQPRPVPKPARRGDRARATGAAERSPSSTSTSTTSSSSTTASATRPATSSWPPSPSACAGPPETDDIVGRDGGDEFLVLMARPSGTLPEATRAAEQAAAARASRIAGAALGQRRRARHPRKRRDQPVPVRRRRRPDAAPARRRRHVRGEGRRARRLQRLPARRARRRRSSSSWPCACARRSPHDELVLHYQPIVELRSGIMTGVEALVRWNDPTRGLIPPDDFIPLAERTGLIRPISEWVIGEASRQAAAMAGRRQRPRDVDQRPAGHLPADRRGGDRAIDQGRGW